MLVVLGSDSLDHLAVAIATLGHEFPEFPMQTVRLRGQGPATRQTRQTAILVHFHECILHGFPITLGARALRFASWIPAVSGCISNWDTHIELTVVEISGP